VGRPLRSDLVDACALEVVGLVCDQRWLADRALERVLRRERRLYAAERRAVAEAAYGMLRMRGQLAWLARAAAGRPQGEGPAAASSSAESPPGPASAAEPGLDPATLYALWLARSRAAAPAAAARRLGVRADLVAAALDRADERIAALADPIERLAVEASLPRWIARRFSAELGEEAARALALAMGGRAPLTIRANLLRADRAALERRLAEEGAAARPTIHSPWGLVLEGHANAFALPSFKEGLFEIQDEGSQLVALAVGARPGQIVADCCAGAGGKSLALAAEMRGKGSLHALDADSGRLEEARRRARRAGVHNLRTRPIPPGADADAALADLAGRCDRVLVDAPCSGLGTLRRRPDARWRLAPGDPERFAALQRELVARFARLVRPGGRLVYATCAIGRVENEDVAASAERELPGFAPLPIAEALGADLARDLGARGHTLQLLPHVHGTDGFFLAAFAREK
jgi:16S rRNA (cytosine967-C5)-methyltransferase